MVDDPLHSAVQDAVAAFADAREAFDQLESRHLPNDYLALGERLRILGDALSEVRRHAAARRGGADRPRVS